MKKILLYIIPALLMASCAKIKVNANIGDNDSDLDILDVVDDDKGDTVNEDVVDNFKSLLSRDMYHELFPKRYGYDLVADTFDWSNDFFSYESLVEAVEEISHIKIMIYKRYDLDYTQKIIWMDKRTGETKEMINHQDYNASWNLSKQEYLYAIVDYATFCNTGSIETRERELAAFFANISHETTGGGFHEKTKTWGLYWREEVAWQIDPNTRPSYYVPHEIYPPVEGLSYHGRGPMQLSYNYNYGQASECLYGDKNVLLSNPGKVLENGKNAFLAAIWFWMTPQVPKPSCHQVMSGEWVPSQDDIDRGRTSSNFGMTVNIINGGLECGFPSDSRVLDRVEFYDRYLDFFVIDRGGDICSCAEMSSYW